MLGLSRVIGGVKAGVWGCRKLSTTMPLSGERNVCFSLSSWFCLPQEDMKEFELLSRASASVFAGPSSTSLPPLLSSETNEFLNTLNKPTQNYPAFLRKLESEALGHKNNDNDNESFPSLALCPPPLLEPFSRTLQMLDSFPSLSFSPTYPLPSSRNYHLFGAGHVTHPYSFLSLYSIQEQSWLRHLLPENTIFWLEIHSINRDTNKTQPQFALPLSSHALLNHQEQESPSCSFSLSSLPVQHPVRDLSMLHFPSLEFGQIFEAAVLSAMSQEQSSSPLFLDDLFSVEKSPLCFFTPEEEEQQEMQRMNENLPRFVNCEGIEVEDDQTSYSTQHSQIECEDVFYFGDQRFAKPNKTLEMGICGGPVRSNRTHHCVGVVEGSVPEEAPPLPSAVLREFPDFKEMGERELQGICEHLSKRMRGTACYVAWPKVLEMIQNYENENQ